MNRLRHETLTKHPNPPKTALEALAHVLAIYEESPDDMVVIEATRNIYPKAPSTGLRLGDLRSLLSDHAHELAEKIRQDTTVMGEAGDQYALAYADLIDPEKEGQ